ncbi:helix-turn-helix transcriptional regulator [Deinococcus cellulosilyticus]|uniref:AraC family transcriptional regulator n=1 Tax=Deinococcus cellulosilyticus (strain DSM 18568 / NBRC 106333 / KACC 11606 / 5516J-15) TaxID=1223518 RepID=A0A511N1S2_DEIC1|nr:AraC family transcriptional regulator [Deinococcus cellulosilyticus]GEM46800.1 AraC family transcriptional regulator [Deinococcus cellulosilyticus NBRC 106333 = KACC 11606]
MTLTLHPQLPIRCDLAGLFVSRGVGTHPDRVVDFHEVIFVREGTLFIAEDGKHYAVNAGEALILLPGKRHWGFEPYQKELSFFWLHFYVQDTAGPQEMVLPKHVQVQRPEHLSALFRRLLDEQEIPGHAPITCDLLALLILTGLSHSEGTPAAPRNSLNRIASEAQAYIALHHQELLSSSRIARALGYNSDYLGRAFRSVYGHTLTEAINRYRVRRACVLLLNTHDTIESIAHACGFREVIYFRRVFRELEGVTPSSYRKLHAQMFVNTE